MDIYSIFKKSDKERPGLNTASIKQMLQLTVQHIEEDLESSKGKLINELLQLKLKFKEKENELYESFRSDLNENFTTHSNTFFQYLKSEIDRLPRDSNEIDDEKSLFIKTSMDILEKEVEKAEQNFHQSIKSKLFLNKKI